MANVPATINDPMPQHLVPYRQENFNQRFAVPAGEPIGLLSIKGKVFTLRYQGESEVIKTVKGQAMPYLDVCLADANPAITKTYWIEGYNARSDTPPDCSSIDGIAPDPRSPHKQAKKCAAWSPQNPNGCKHNIFGTAENGKGKRCGDGKRVVVQLAHDMENPDWGGPLLLRVPPTSFKAFMRYTKKMDSEGKDLNLIITRIFFVAESEHPQIDFEYRGWLNEDQAAVMREWADSEHIQRMLMTSPVELADAVADEDVEPEVAPARAASNTAAEKIAAAKVATKAAPNGKAAAATKPAPAKKAPVVIEAEAEEVEVAPVKRATANVVPIKKEPAPVAKAVKTAKAPEQTEADKKKAQLAAMIAAAEKLQAELEAGDGPSEAEVEMEAAGAEEAEAEVEEEATEDGADMSTEDLLGAIDDELENEVPDE